jgi:hypothetical protein
MLYCKARLLVLFVQLLLLLLLRCGWLTLQGTLSSFSQVLKGDLPGVIRRLGLQDSSRLTEVSRQAPALAAATDASRTHVFF